MIVYLGLLIIGSIFAGVWVFLVAESYFEAREDKDPMPERNHVTIKQRPFDWEKEGW